MEVLRPKGYHRKKAFFETTKKLKIGRGWPKSAGTAPDRFWTSLQKHLTPFHKKISVRSSILKNILASDSGAIISGQHGIHKPLSKDSNLIFSFIFQNINGFINLVYA